MPFTKDDLTDFLARVPLSSSARDYILQASNGPSRDVGTSPYRTIVSDFPSRKMGTSVATESRTGELAYAILLEYSDDVVAFYDQPPAIDCIRTDRRGRTGVRLYHPDFLVLGTDGAEVIQIKTREQANKLTADRPNEWIVANNLVVDLAANQAFDEIGLPHRVICSDELPRIRTSNLRLLLQTRNQIEKVPMPLRSAIEQQLCDRSVQSISQLSKALALNDLTPILRLIDDGTICCDLDRTLLTDNESCLLSKSRALLSAALDESLSGWRWKSGATVDDVPPHKQAEQALKNLERLASEPASRTARRWRRSIADQQAHGRSAFYALLPKTFRSGNRFPKRPLPVIAFAEHVIRQHWATAARPLVSSVYREYRASASEWHPDHRPVSRPTFTRLVEELRQNSAFARGGSRLANSLESPTPVQQRAVKATRPFECAICDHYLTDIWCVLARSGEDTYPARPWLSVMRDVATGMVLASWISFRPPSRLACAMLVRSCARRHSRLPEEIIVDRGAEFRSVYFASLLVDRGVTLTFRPAGHARYGSEAERFFGLFRTQWLDSRPGSIDDLKDRRSISRSHDASSRASIEVVDLLRELEQYREWLANCIPSGRTKSPHQMMVEGLSAFPCSGIHQVVDDAFLISSAVDERQIKLDPQRGLQVSERYFWSEALAAPGLSASQLLVRIDPENLAHVYVRVSGRWTAAFSRDAQQAAAADPIALLARSIISMDGRKARQIAREVNDNKLVEALRKADAKLSNPATPAGRHAPDDHDPFSDPSNLNVEPAQASSWRKP